MASIVSGEGSRADSRVRGQASDPADPVDEIERRRRQVAERLEQHGRRGANAAGEPCALRAVTDMRHPQVDDVPPPDRLGHGGIGRQAQ